MNYSLSISGGITGIPKKYVGEVTLSTTAQKRIQEILNAPPPSTNENLRDGLQYHLQVYEGNLNYESTFDDSNLPDELRNFITTILNQD
tara:strand:+ start:30599 stop:30865 length:267 start_codon:yes stop_codon:yes gene_type:complete